MRGRGRSIGLLVVMAAIAAASLPAPAGLAGMLEIASRATPLFLGRFEDWTIWEFEGNEHRICYAITGLEGASLSRSFRPALIVTLKPNQQQAPGQHAVHEFSVRSDKIAHHGGRLQAEVGGRRFPLFKKDDHAWLDSNVAAETTLLDAMRLALTLTVRGTGGGSRFTERFSLRGFTRAEEAMSDICLSSSRT